jgi:hypothetical protein
MAEISNLNLELQKQFGPIIGGTDLMRALGFRSMPAMRKAIQEKRLGVEVFKMPGRRGKFALTEKVAAFIENCARR